MDHSSTILLVDDDDMARDVITRLLKRAMPGWNIVAAVDGESGLEAFTRLNPVLLITDMKMGQMTGQELVTKVRSTSPHLPIIVVSGAPESKAVPGATETILKVNFNHLISRVKALLNVETSPGQPLPN